MRDFDPDEPPRSAPRAASVARDEERRFRSTLETFPTPTLLADRSGALVAGNEAFRSCFALSRARLRRMGLADLAEDGGPGEPLRLMARELAGGGPPPSARAAWCRRGDGRRLFCRIAAAPATGSASGARVVAFEDRTALQERCDGLEARWAAALRVADHLDEAVLVGTQDLRSLAWASAAVERVLGLAPEVLRAAPRSLLSAIHPDDKASVARLLADASAPTAVRIRFPGRDGVLRRLRLRVVRLGEPESPPLVALLAKDETARVEAGALADELAHASSEMAARLRSLAGSIARPSAVARDAASPPEDRVQSDFEERLATLSPREREVLELVVEGRSTKQICAALGLRPSTVGVHRAALVRKLGVKSSAALLRRLVFAKASRGNL